MQFKLKNNFNVTTHAAKRYLERIMGRAEDDYTPEEIGIIKSLIRTMLANKAHNVVMYKVDGVIRIAVRDAVFVYSINHNEVFTTVENDLYRGIRK